MKIAVVGDSLADNLGHGLEAWAASRRDVAVYNLSISACPISRGGSRRWPNGYDWPIHPLCAWWGDPASDRSKKLAEFDPDVVLMHDALNVVVDRRLPHWPLYQRPGDFDFDQWLHSEYSAAARVFAQGGAKVVALNSVCADWQKMQWHWPPSEGQYRLAALDRVTARLANGHLTAELGKKVCPDGRFTETVAGVDRARPDGYHITLEGATALAEQWLGPLALAAVPS